MKVGICDWKGDSLENALNVWFQKQKDEENIPFPFLYVSMVVTEVGSVSSIDMPARCLRPLEITECVDNFFSSYTMVLISEPF
jgi:hypothetical protein